MKTKIPYIPELVVLILFSSMPLFSQGQTGLKNAFTNPSSPSTCDMIEVQITGDLPASNYSFDTSNVSHVGMQIIISLNYNSSGFGLPAITPFQRKENIGYLSSGNYDVTVYLSFNNSPADTLKTTFSVQPGSSSINLVDNAAYCEGDSVLLDASVTGGTNYNWSTGSTSANAYFSKIGQYWVSVDVGPSCTITDTFHITVSPLPNVDLGPDTSLCGTAYKLNATSSGATYQWKSGSTSAIYDVTNSGSYWVKVTKNKCSNHDTVQVTLLSAPQFDLGPDTSLCEGETLLLKTGKGNNVTYHWHDNSTDSTFLVENTGTYWVEIENSNGCLSSDSINVQYNDAPSVNLGGTIEIASGDSVKISPGSFSAYQWSTGDTTASIFAVHGSYSVTVTDINGCTTADTVQVVFAQGLSPISDIDFSVYPNPTTGNITLSGITEESRLTFYDMAGRRVWKKTIKNPAPVTIDLKYIPGGNYFLKIQTADQVHLTKIILSKD